MKSRLAGWLAVAFLVALIAVVFQQIVTSMREQGIASGGPYDNAAAYPAAVAVVIAILLVIQGVLSTMASGTTTVAGTSSAEAGSMLETTSADTPQQSRAALRRAIGLLLVFAVYLGALQPLGYHLSTTPMLMAIMWLCGLRQPLLLIGMSLLIAFSLAFLFEHFLKVVLPGGLFALNLSW